MCDCCSTARAYPSFAFFNPACVFCGARLIQRIQRGCNHLSPDAKRERLRGDLDRWLAHGHNELRIRALAKSMQWSIEPAPTPDALPRRKGVSA